MKACTQARLPLSWRAGRRSRGAEKLSRVRKLFSRSVRPAAILDPLLRKGAGALGEVMDGADGAIRELSAIEALSLSWPPGFGTATAR